MSGGLIMGGCSAELAARSPTRCGPMPLGLAGDAGSGETPHSIAKPAPAAQGQFGLGGGWVRACAAGSPAFLPVFFRCCAWKVPHQRS